MRSSVYKSRTGVRPFGPPVRDFQYLFHNLLIFKPVEIGIVIGWMAIGGGVHADEGAGKTSGNFFGKQCAVHLGGQGFPSAGFGCILEGEVLFPGDDLKPYAVLVKGCLRQYDILAGKSFG